jgi:hypothetical protein
MVRREEEIRNEKKKGKWEKIEKMKKLKTE